MTITSAQILTELRSNSEYVDTDPDGTRWGGVYIDNAIPAGLSRHAFAGHLSDLTKQGLYRPYGDDCWGSVKMAD